ncbi:MAG TPA: 7TM diverse intracellular signaling domain-containing protein [Oligoflexus sp.]|uniref:7TM diverse intracellular signaling domain-containing protein n=1 Tax=Oligoflexus sp. TaxID=1971216 RepID=UPI002D5BC78F|nr:7TM diverse intracellular signaling domain-containing protein [Oligoflexus sp.]HYX38397.1 7TM diverse intracellular signaling domain-containing protein [Oligoflexus sp.]
MNANPHVRCIIIVLLCMGFFAQEAWSASLDQRDLELQAESERITVSRFSYFVDDTNLMPREDVVAQDKWTTHDGAAFNFGFSKAGYWLKFRIDNKDEALRDWILEFQYPSIDHIDLYIVRDNGDIIQKQGGDLRPFAQRDIAYRTTNFMMSLQAREAATLYLKIYSQSSIQGPMILWTPKRFIEKASNELVGVSLYLGIIVAMVVYNFFLFLNIRDRSYIYYVGYVSFYGYAMASLFGLGFQYVLTDWPALANHMVPFTISICAIFLLLFSGKFLQLKQYSPMLNHTFRFLLLVGISAMVSSIFSYSLGIKLSAGLAVMGAISVMAAGIVCLRRGYRPAFFFVLAFTAFLSGTTFLQLVTFGFMEPSFLSTYGMHFGSSIEMLLLSVALGDKIKYEQYHSRKKIEHLNSQLKEEHKKIVALNEGLEVRVEQQTRDIRSMMQHIRLGIFTIAQDGRILKDYSAFLERIFQRGDLTGVKAVELLQVGTEADHDALSQLSSILNSTLGEPELSFDLNEGSLIRELKQKNSGGPEKILELEWSPIVNRRNLIEKILVTIRDVTQLRDLQHVAATKKKELEFIGEIAPVAREQFTRFMSSAEKHIEECQRLTSANSSMSHEALKIILINMHTIKGTARSLGFRQLTQAVHEAEHYAGLLQSGHADWNQARLKQDLGLIQDILAYYQHVNDRILERSINRSSIELEILKVENILRALAALPRTSLASDLTHLLQEIEFMLARPFHQLAQAVLAEVATAAQRLAKDLRKELPKVDIIDDDLFFTHEGADLLRNILGHLIRNSMDHGIESPEERKSVGKVPSGTVCVWLREVDDEVELQYFDDGRGLPLQMIREIALIRGLIRPTDPLTPEELAHMIFLPGFSTSESVTEISGRGVGMGAIKSYTEKAGGRLSLVLMPEAGHAQHAAFIPFHIKIYLPGRTYRRFAEALQPREEAA